MGNGSKLRVVLDKAYREEVTFESGVTLHQDTWLNSERKTTLWGTVVFVPLHKADCPILDSGNECPECKSDKFCSYSPKSVKQDIKSGDRICFRYDVVADGDISEGGSRKHENLIYINDRWEWMVNYNRVFLLEQNGLQSIVGNYALCEKVEVARLLRKFIILPGSEKTETIPHLLKIVDIGENKKGVCKGDTVLVHPAFVQHYNFTGIYGKDHAIVSHRHILAKIVTA